MTMLFGDDGCIHLDGDLCKVFTVDPDGETLIFSDGTFVRVALQGDVWRLAPLIKGSLYSDALLGAPERDDEVDFDDGLLWAVVDGETLHPRCPA